MMKKIFQFKSNRIVEIYQIKPLFEDQRGWLINAYGSSQNQDMGKMLQPRLIFSKPGVIRGNHYHMAEVETIIFLNGEWQMIFADIDGSKNHKITIDCTKSPTKVIISAKVAHVFKNISKQDAYIFHFSDKPYSEDRSEKFVLLE